ncbi:MAG: hypothetical protein KDH97_09250 [Calditrichaeota bacterium]|nr:hypothetical protein [Calditrichota bacterium]MCB9089354.1 hypothetical protein [Calditrichia bacterium]MCB0290428.1 hypothetical protein [Calditrichota bacterium]MCB0295060.1 hypothetical protein [Calditrichota bacterium]MCB0304132.1 hypothetical protein [Calditrichota bacterium]
MGRTIGAICNQCDREFTINEGGGFHFDLLRCDRCGRSIGVPREVVQAPEQYAAASGWFAGVAAFWKRVRQAFGRSPHGDAGAVSETTDRVSQTVPAGSPQCECGGSFIHDAPPRCPFCGSADYRNNPDFGMIMYD